MPLFFEIRPRNAASVWARTGRSPNLPAAAVFRRARMGRGGEGFVDGSMTGTERECEENMGRAEKSGPTWKNGPAEDTKISRILKKMPAWRRRALGVLAAAMTAFQLYMKLAAPTGTRAQMPVYLCCALIVVFLFSPAAEKGKNKDSRRKKLWWIYDGVLIAAALVEVYNIFHVVVNVSFGATIHSVYISSASAMTYYRKIQFFHIIAS